MASVSAVSQTIPAMPPLPAGPCGWTDVKIKQAALKALSGALFLGSMAAGSLVMTASCLPLLGVAIPLTLASGALLLYSRTLVDYEDPRVLLGLRDVAAREPLLQSVEKHGWDKLFRYQLLTPSDFETLYRARASTLDFGGVLSLCRDASMALREVGSTLFSIPSPLECKEKFQQETQGLRCDKIALQYPLKELIEHRILTPAERAALEATIEAMQRQQRRAQELEEKFKDETPYEHTSLENARRLAEMAFKTTASSAQASIDQIEYQALREIDLQRDWTKSQICREQTALADFKHSLGACLTEQQQQELQARECSVKRTIEQLRSEEWFAIQSIRSQAERRKAPLCDLLGRLAHEKDLAIRLAEGQFQQATRQVRGKIDQLHEENRAWFAKQIDQLNEQYHAKS